jgi:hypothetical protein
MKKAILTLIVVTLTISLFATNIDGKLLSLTKDNATGFLKPLSSLYYYNLNAGNYNTAKVLSPLKFGALCNVSYTIVPDNLKKFNAKTFEGTRISTSTILGKTGNNGFPGGANLSIIPMVIPQVSLGLPFGNELMVRYFPKTETIKEFGKVSFIGFGLKHSISQYLPGLLPIDLAVQGVYQDLKIGDSFEISTLSFNSEISKKLLMFTFYGGVNYGNSSTSLKYTYQPDYDGIAPMKLDFSYDTDSQLTATGGIRWSFLLLKLYADYTIGEYSVINTGFGLSF